MKKAELLFVKVNALIFFLIMIAINYVKQPEISAIAQISKPFIQPAGFTFAIWTVIYIWLFAWLIFSFFKSAPSARLYETLKYLLPLNFTFNALWVISFTAKQFLLSCVFIVLVLITVALIYIKLRSYSNLSLFITGVFSVYLGWISIATVVNIFSYVNRLSPPLWNEPQQLTATVITIALLALFSVYMLYKQRDFLIHITIIWSILGIALNKSNTYITVLCFCFIALLLALLGIYIYKTRSTSRTFMK